MQDRTISVVLAGGAGARLHPLTVERAKPAVPFGGNYRIIDFTLSNCLHSGMRRILVLTQCKSHSLHKQLRDGWSVFNPSVVTKSILSRNVRIEEGAVVTDCIVFDDVRVGPGAQLKRCIVDKHVHIPPGEKIGFDSYRDSQRFVISDGGLVVVPRDYRFSSLVAPEKPRPPNFDWSTLHGMTWNT